MKHSTETQSRIPEMIAQVILQGSKTNRWLIFQKCVIMVARVDWDRHFSYEELSW